MKNIPDGARAGIGLRGPTEWLIFQVIFRKRAEGLKARLWKETCVAVCCNAL